MSSERTDPRRVVYTVPAATAVRGVGVGALLVGGGVIGATVLLATGADGPLVTLGLLLCGVLSVVGLLVLGVGALRLLGRGARVVIDDDGFHNATGPGRGVGRVRWREVTKIQSDGPVVSVDLAGDRRSLIRTQSLDVEPKPLAREMRRHLGPSRRL